MSPPSLAAAAWLLGATVLAGLALRPAVGDALLLPRYVGYVMPWLLLALVPGAAWALHARRVALAALLGVCAATIVAEHAEMLRPRPRPVIAPGFGLDVLSWNTWSRNHDAARIAGVIRARAPDLVLLQEIPWPVFEEVRAALGVGAYMHAEYALGLDQGVLSRFPLEPRAVMADKGQAQEVVVRTPAGAITVFNVHPLRTGGWRVRHDQVVRLLEEDVRSERGRVMVAGDLNVNERTQLYRRLRERMVNAHDAAGRGFGFTYPAGLEVPGIGAMPAFPAVRIDHVFVSPDLVVVEAGTLEDAGGSDHRPVYARVAVGAGGESPGR